MQAWLQQDTGVGVGVGVRCKTIDADDASSSFLSLGDHAMVLWLNTVDCVCVVVA